MTGVATPSSLPIAKAPAVTVTPIDAFAAIVRVTEPFTSYEMSVPAAESVTISSGVSPSTSTSATFCVLVPAGSQIVAVDTSGLPMFVE